jgi:VanZ family protein
MRLWLPVALCAAVIFAISSIPSLGTELGTWDLVLRKLAHTAEYAVLGALLVRALGRPAPALALGVLYAVSDELHQHFVPGRRGAPFDVLIDAVGVTIGILVWRSLVQPSPRAFDLPEPTPILGRRRPARARIRRRERPPGRGS